MTTTSETPVPRSLEVPLLPEGFRYRVVEAKSATLHVQIVVAESDAAVADYVTGPERMGMWENMVGYERVETALRIMGGDFLRDWRISQENNEMMALVGDYERTGVRLR